MPFSSSRLWRFSSAVSISTPWRSMAPRIGTSGARCPRRRSAARASRPAAARVPVQAQRDVRVLGRVRRRGLDRHLVEADLLRALAGDVLVVDGRRVRGSASAPPSPCRGASRSSRARRTRAWCRSGCPPATMPWLASTWASYFRWWPILPFRILQQRPQPLERRLEVELLGRAGIAVRQRHIGGAAPARLQTRRRRSAPACSRGCRSRCRRRTSSGASSRSSQAPAGRSVRTVS
jgi:hypothetical protein